MRALIPASAFLTAVGGLCATLSQVCLHRPNAAGFALFGFEFGNANKEKLPRAFRGGRRRRLWLHARRRQDLSSSGSCAGSPTCKVARKQSLESDRETSALNASLMMSVGAGTIAGVILGLRRASAEQRRAMLRRENEEGLRAICVQLRVKSTGAAEKLVQSIEEGLAADDAECRPEAVVGILARKFGPHQETARTLLQKYKMDKLKELCTSLRLRKAGKKSELIERIARELHELWVAYDSNVLPGTQADVKPELANADGDGAGYSAEAEQSGLTAEYVQQGFAGDADGGAESGYVSSEPSDAVDASDSAQADQPADPAEDAAYDRGGPEYSEQGTAEYTTTASYEYHSGEPAPEEVSDGPFVAEPGVAEGGAYDAPAGDPEVEADGYAETSAGDSYPEGHASDYAASGELREHVAYSSAEYGREAGAATAYQHVEEEEAVYERRETGSSVVETTSMANKQEEDMLKRHQRMLERRMKLAGYLAEEVAETMGSHRQKYLKDMQRVLQEAPVETREAYLSDKLEAPKDNLLSERVPRVLSEHGDALEYGAWHSEPVQEEMQMIGECGPARQAWCKWWDQNTGCGELVDMQDHSAVAVVSSALTTAANVSPRLKYLHQSEFVEYRRVHTGPSSAPRAVLVRGLRGWPLMCEVDGGRALNA